jgi:ATP-binding cassette subfamily C protein
MSASLAIGLKTHAHPAPASNAPFSVEDPGSVWLVDSGRLDLFAIVGERAASWGPRFHVMRVEEGQAVFGVGFHLDDMTLVATASPGTSLVHLTQKHVQELARVKGHNLVLQWLEKWTSGLTAAVTEDAALGPFTILEPGETITIPPPTRAILPKQGLVWVTHLQGASFFRNAFFLGSDKIPLIFGSDCFPVTRQGWLQAAPGSEIHTIDPDELWQQDLWPGLQTLHAIVMGFLAIKWQNAAEKERGRIQERHAADAKTVHSAILRLASPIKKTKQLTEVNDVCRDPIFLACKTVGNCLGIKIKPHADMLRGLPVVDPISSIARASGLRVRGVALKGDWWKQDNGPLLAFREQDKKPVALLPLSPRSYELYDPAENKSVRVNQEVASTLDRFAHVLYRPFPARKLGALDLLKFSLPVSRRDIVMISMMGLAAGLLGMITPIATQIVFDRLIPGAERTQLLQMSAFLLITAVAAAMFNLVRSFSVLRLEGKLDVAMQSAVWDRLLNLPVSFFRNYSSGDLAQRSLGIAAIREALTGATLSAILSGIFSIFNFALLFYYSTSLALVATALVLCACSITVVCGILQVRFQRQIAKLSGSISSMLLQFITGIAKFRVSGTEGRAFAVWSRDFSRKKQIATKSRRVSNFLTVFIAMFPIASLGLIFYCHQALLAMPQSTQITTGSFLAFFGAFIQFLTASLVLSSSVVSSLSVVPVYERALPILHAMPEVTEDKANPGKLTGAIEVSHVTFRYGADALLVLRDVSISIRPGQFVAIVGASGSGKSTLLRLLLGFESPESGAIYYDGQDLASLDPQEVRRQIGVVLQSSRPMSGSIFHNIVGSAPLIVDDAWEAARLAGIEEDIRQMPMGLHTYLSDGGGGISGGQRQRLMIARAIVARPRILLFDEATSALDNQTQAIVSRSLESLQATRIVIAHRLSTIMNADYILVLDKGRIAQTGIYAQLIEQDGIFRDLAKRQII